MGCTVPLGMEGQLEYRYFFANIAIDKADCFQNWNP